MLSLFGVINCYKSECSSTFPLQNIKLFLVSRLLGMSAVGEGVVWQRWDRVSTNCVFVLMNYIDKF